MSKAMPQAFSDLADRYDANDIQVRHHETMDYFREAPDKLGWVSEGVRDTVMKLCDAATNNFWRTKTPGQIAVSTGDTVMDEAAFHAYVEQRALHAFEGTLILSLLDRILRKRGPGRFEAVRASLRKDRRLDPMSWALARHFGRPSVPQEVLPVFAVFEAERRLGRPLANLSDAQMRVIGLC
jgi:hypothetical protein